jgi:hypothetical protein
MKCQCETLTQLEGVEAYSYVEGHLHKVQVSLGGWQIEYICPNTGKRWLLDYPYSEAHGGGPPRLRRLPLIPDLPNSPSHDGP